MGAPSGPVLSVVWLVLGPGSDLSVLGQAAAAGHYLDLRLAALMAARRATRVLCQLTMM
jgi:hypothetical protein